MNALRTPGRLTRRSISIDPTGITHRHHSFWRRGEGARDHYSFGDLAFYGWRTRIEVGEEGGDRTSRARSLTAPRPVTTTAGQDLFYWVQFDEGQYDVDGDGPYGDGEILASYLEPI